MHARIVSSDTSYTRQNIKIDHQGIKAEDEQKTATPTQKSFIKDISDIQILGALGSGQSGYVSQAIHTPTQRIIAIKVKKNTHTLSLSLCLYGSAVGIECVKI